MSPTEERVEGLVSPETQAPPVETEAPPPEPPQPILPNDPEGRQAGMPDDPIELPAYLTAPPRQTYPVIAGPNVPTEEEMLKAMNITPAAAPAAFPSSIPAPAAPHSPVPQTAPVMPASFGGGSLINEATGMVSIEQAAPSTMMTAQTLAELEYGKKVVERNRMNAERNRAISATAAARRLANGAPADAEDLNYIVPKS